MNRILKLALCALAAASSLPVVADDFGLRSGLEASKDLGAGFSLDADLGFRLQDDWQSVDRWSAGLGVNYKPWRFLKFSAGYTYMYQYKMEETKAHFKKNNGVENGYNVTHPYWRSKNRFTLAATGSFEVARFTFSLREQAQITRFCSASAKRDKWRYQNQTERTDPMLTESDVDQKSAKTKNYLRSRVGVDYNIRHCPLTPYAHFELTNNLSNGFSLDKRRVDAGVEYKITKQHRLSLGYVYDNGEDDESNGHIHCIEVGYRFKF